MSKLRVRNLFVLGVAAAGAVVASGACSSTANGPNGAPDGGTPAGDSSTSSGGETATVGATGGNLQGPDGFDLSIPAGALTSSVSVQAAALAKGSYPANMPALPSGWTLQSYVYSFQPHGQKFALPVSVSLPYSGAPSSSVVSAEPSGKWSVSSGVTFGTSLASFTTTHFSFYAVVTMGSSSGGDGGSHGDAASNADSGTAPCGSGCTNSAGSCTGGVCTCPTGYSTCNNVCVNEQLDDSNCGGCGIKCDESCTAGECEVTFSSTESAVALAVDATNLYWVNSSGSVVKVAISGGSTTTLATGQNSPQAIALDSANVYWTTTDGNVATVPKSSTGSATPSDVASGQSGILGLAISGGNADWGASGDADYEIRTVPTSGTGAPTLVSAFSSGPAYGVAVDSTSVYWTTKSGLFSAALAGIGDSADGGAPVTSLGGLGGNGVVALAIDSSNAYWGSFAAGGGTLQKVAKTGGGATQLASGQFGPNGLAVDSSSIYWTTQAGLVLKLPLSGGSPTTLASVSNGGTGIVVDATTVYWASGNTVQKITPK